MIEFVGLILMWIKKKRGGLSLSVLVLAGIVLVFCLVIEFPRSKKPELILVPKEGPSLPAPEELPTPLYTLPVIAPYKEKEAPKPKVWMSVGELPVSLSPDSKREHTQNFTLFTRLFVESMVRKGFDESSARALNARWRADAKEGKTTREDVFAAIRAEFPNLDEFEVNRIFYSMINTLDGLGDAIREENKKYAQ